MGLIGMVILAVHLLFFAYAGAAMAMAPWKIFDAVESSDLNLEPNPSPNSNPVPHPNPDFPYDCKNTRSLN